MSEQDQINRKAWNPLTFRELAKFASAKLPRLLLVEFLFSFLIFVSVVWFVSRNYVPVIVRAIHQLPDTGRLENGAIKGIESRVKAEGKFLSLVLDTNDLSDTGTGDLQIAFGQTNFWVCSGVSSSWGCLGFDYPREAIELSRPNVQPWWGARQPIIIGAVGVFFVVATLIMLPLFALILMWLPKIAAYFADRELTVREAWRLATAAQLPGIIVLTAAIVLYGTQAMDVLGIGVFYLLHVVVDVVYLAGAVFFLPRIRESIATNPFVPPGKKSS